MVCVVMFPGQLQERNTRVQVGQRGGRLGLYTDARSSRSWVLSLALFSEHRCFKQTQHAPEPRAGTPSSGVRDTGLLQFLRACTTSATACPPRGLQQVQLPSAPA